MFLFQRLRTIASRLPAVAVLPLAGVPVAAAAAAVVGALAATAGPVARYVELPERAPRPSWDEEVSGFAARLEDAFGVRGARAEDFSAWILEASDRQRLPPELVASLIATESSFRTRVRSWAGAVGPAQVKPRLWRDFCGGADLADPEHNVYCGAQILAHYMDRCGDFDCALRLYNVGPSNLRKPHFERASDRYLAKVEDHRSRFTPQPGVPQPGAY